MKKILIAGGSGLIGKGLSAFLYKEGNQLSCLSREQANTDYPTYLWNPASLEMDAAAISGKDVIIQLAGSNIASGLWTKKRKQQIIDSRILAIQTLHAHLKKHGLYIPHIIQASAIGYYGNRGSEILDEQSYAATHGFLAEVCKIWESEAACLKEYCDRFTIIRTGLYLSTAGGIWPRMLYTHKYGFLVYFGTGLQYQSWIHHHDFNRAISHIIHHPLDPIVNLCTPNPVSNKNFILAIKRKLSKKSLLLRAPVHFLKCLPGGQSELVLDSTCAIPVVLRDGGFQFEFGHLDEAIDDLLK